MKNIKCQTDFFFEMGKKMKSICNSFQPSYNRRQNNKKEQRERTEMAVYQHKKKKMDSYIIPRKFEINVIW